MMASPVHFFSPMPPLAGKVSHTAVSSNQAIDIPGVLGEAALVLGGFVSFRASADVYIALGPTGTVVTPTGASAGWYVPTGVAFTFEVPEASSVTGASAAYQYLWVTAAAGTADTWIYKSSANGVQQYMRYARGIDRGGI